MKTRQFKRLVSIAPARRVDVVIEGLRAIGANVLALAAELAKCNEVHAFRSARLAYNAAREEAGKFLVLIDVWRAPDATHDLIERQFGRAGDHLSKLMYAQIADYSIGSQSELLRAIGVHRRGLYLDGPNDYDWIFRNDLLSEREGALYVDFVDSEGALEWSGPSEYQTRMSETYSIILVRELLETNLVTAEGLDALAEAWTDFDPHEDSHCQRWVERTATALLAFPRSNCEGSRLNSRAAFVARQWPMPMVELDVEEEKRTVAEVQAERRTMYETMMEAEFGDGRELG